MCLSEKYSELGKARSVRRLHCKTAPSGFPDRQQLGVFRWRENFAACDVRNHFSIVRNLKVWNSAISQQLPRSHTKCPDVRFLAVPALLEGLGREVPDRFRAVGYVLVCRRIRVDGQSKIADLKWVTGWPL